jgi:hypothetical protein
MPGAAQRESAKATVLLVALEALPNTRERVEGFAAGFRAAFSGDVVFHRVDGRGVFREAMRQALDALHTHPAINIAFGANDHTTLGAIEAAQRAGGMQIECYSVGGEGSALFDELSRDGPLRATLALFPEVVGRIAIDASCRHFVGQDIGKEVLTPAEILTPESLQEYYTRDVDHWRLRPQVMNRMTAAWTYSGAPQPGRTWVSSSITRRTNGIAIWRLPCGSDARISASSSPRAMPRTRSRNRSAASAG